MMFTSKSKPLMLLLCFLLAAMSMGVTGKVSHGSGSETYHIANAGFENAGEAGEIPDWLIRSGNPVISNEQAHVGERSLKAHLVKDQGQPAINIESGLINVEENTSYLFSTQVYLELGSIQGFYVYVYDTNGQLVKGADGRDFHLYQAITAPKEDWQYIEQPFTVQPGGHKLKVALITGAKNSFTFYVDEVNIMKQMVNGGMEQPVVDGAIPGWSKTKPADADSFSVTDTHQSSGEHSLHIRNTQGAFINVISDLVPVEPGATYTAKARTLIEAGSADMYMRYFRADGSYTGKQNWSIVSEPVDVWFDQYVTGTIPDDAEYAAILFAGSPTKNYSYYVDDIKLLRGAHDIPEEPTPDNSITLVGENLGPQIRKATLMRGAIGKDNNGRNVIYTVVAGAPSIFTVIDIEAEQVVKSLPMPDTSGAWSVTMSSDGSVYLGAYNLGLLYRYIPDSDELINLGHPLASKDSVLYPMAAGKDGIMYGSTYPTAHLYAYDPDGGGFTDYGTLSTQTSGERWTRVTAYDETTHKIYAGVGNVPRLVEYDLATGAKRDLLPEGFGKIVSVYDLNIADGKLFARKEANNPNETFVIDIESGDMIEFENEDTGELSTTFINFSRGVSPVSPIANKIYFAGTGGELFEYNLDTDSYRTTGASIEGAAIAYAYVELNEPGFPGYSLVGLSGNTGKMFKYNLETGSVKLTDVQVPAEPVNIHEITKGPNGKIYSAGYLQGNLGVYAPSSGESMYYEGIGQGEGMTVVHDKLYLGVYPGAAIFEYDLSKPWDRTNSEQLNPSRLFTMGDINQDRPFGMAGSEDMNKLFVGTVPKNGMLGGALAVYDLESRGEPDIYPNLVPDQSILSLVYKNGYLYGGTSIHGGQGGATTQTDAKLFVWDVAAKEKVLELVPAAGKQAITALHIGPDGNVWGLANGTIFIFDIESREIVHRDPAFPNARGRWIDGSMTTGTDGNVYATVGGNFFKVDARSKEIEVLATGVRKLTQDDFGNFYMFTDPETPILYKYTIEELLLNLTGAQLTISETELKAGETAMLETTGLLEQRRTTKDLSGAVTTYASSNSAVAAVNEDGLVTAVGAGTAQLTVQVTLDGVTVTSNAVSVSVTGGSSEPESPVGPPSGTGGTETIVVEGTTSNGSLVGIDFHVIRTKQPDGQLSDRLAIGEELARRLTENANGASVIDIRMPETGGAAVEWVLALDQSASELLSKAGLSLVLSGAEIRISLSGDSWLGLNQELSFRIKALRTSGERLKLEAAANNDAGIAESAGGSRIRLIGTPVAIDTDVGGKPVTLLLPLDPDIVSSTSASELGVYIEHSDGSMELVKGKLVYGLEPGEVYVSITVDRFSTFSAAVVSGWEVNEADAQHYMQGYEDGTFRPDRIVSPAEMAAMIVRAWGAPKTNATAKSEDWTTGETVAFYDLTGSHWAKRYIDELASSGIVRGYEDGTFRPERDVTRAEMAVVLAALALDETASDGAKPSDTASFHDMEGHWASDAVTRLKSSGLVKGYEDGTFRPDRPLTRAEAVVMINALLGVEPNVHADPLWPDVPSDHWAYGDIQAAYGGRS
ncbi:S-layer homology domain-containing protein [Paenibacillus sp. PAMC21692]|uniref:S-layer homology domain-containing protein n=1 Tax=Paenibacillus sp. PAMC21692 TaxID=2762320 RepID=UPI00164E0412|nr:S-layer homology domain-containing protein [Paenibacillus sp. PAMC21692]QNK56683.1 S-layer homology domain-containing protein [Paenibacillus sp. PAMC21692]